MAPRLHFKFIGVIIVISVCPAVFLGPAHAAEYSNVHGGQPAEIKQNVIKFFLDPSLVPDMDFARTALQEYVQDLNTILAKNTLRRLVFDPETGIILTRTQPFSNSFYGLLPDEGFEIWICASASNTHTSYGGYAGLDISGAGVLAGLKWAKLYDPDRLKPDNLIDYWTQVNNMLHELAHVFGAGLGEYYKLTHIQDMTSDSPFLNINILDPDDSFWGDKKDFKLDPLLQNAVQALGTSWHTRQELLDYVQFSNLTAAIISGSYRNSAPTADLQHIIIKVVTPEGIPLNSAEVKIWSVTGAAPFPSGLLVDAGTDANGNVEFSWGGAPNPHNNYDFLRLIKVYKDGYIASARYISIFDADIAKLVEGQDTLTIEFILRAEPPAPILDEGDTITISMSQDAYPTPFSLTLSANENDLSWCIFSPARHGNASVSGSGNSHSISYHPDRHYFGSDSFVVQVEDNSGATDAITVNVTINGSDDGNIRLFLPLIQH